MSLPPTTDSPISAEGRAIIASLHEQSEFYRQAAERNNGTPRPDAGPDLDDLGLVKCPWCGDGTDPDELNTGCTDGGYGFCAGCHTEVCADRTCREVEYDEWSDR